jgi:hypothetical protein
MYIKQRTATEAVEGFPITSNLPDLACCPQSLIATSSHQSGRDQSAQDR